MCSYEGSFPILPQGFVERLSCFCKILLGNESAGKHLKKPGHDSVLFIHMPVLKSWPLTPLWVEDCSLEVSDVKRQPMGLRYLED